MIKFVYCVARRQDISADEFHRYWLEEHGALVRSYMAVLKARRYTQSHTLETEANRLIREARGTGEPFDGIAEVWWDNTETLAAAMNSPEAQAAGKALIEDEAKFIDFTRSAVFLTEEYVIFEQ